MSIIPKFSNVTVLKVTGGSVHAVNASNAERNRIFKRFLIKVSPKLVSFEDWASDCYYQCCPIQDNCLLHQLIEFKLRERIQTYFSWEWSCRRCGRGGSADRSKKQGIELRDARFLKRHSLLAANINENRMDSKQFIGRGGSCTPRTDTMLFFLSSDFISTSHFP